MPAKVSYELPPLYHTAKSGETRVWKIWTEGRAIVTSYGYLEGKQMIARKIAIGKKTGTKAATTPEEQAEKEAEATFKKKLKGKYFRTIAESQETSTLPMSVQKYMEKKHKAVWPMDAQPKLNGLRCTARCKDGVVTLYSRGGEIYELPHISKELETWIDDGVAFDGELYIHGVPLQTLNSWVPMKGQTPHEESIHIEYHVYDLPYYENERELPWHLRRDYLSDIFGNEELKMVFPVWESPVNNEAEAMAAMESYIDAGYEGAILRNQDGLYEWGHRSSDVMKLKKFTDEEFEVVGYKDGVGKHKGIICFICKNNDDTENTFDAVPRGTMEERAEMFKNGDSYIGKILTVKYQDRSKKNIPLFPVGICFRLEADLPK